MQESVDFLVGVENITKKLCYVTPLQTKDERKEQATATVSLIHKPYVTRDVTYSTRPLQLFNNGPKTQVYDTTIKNGPFLEAECQIPVTSRIITDADTSTMVDGICVRVGGIYYVGWDFSKGTNVNDYYLGLHYDPTISSSEAIPFATLGGTNVTIDTENTDVIDGVTFYMLPESSGMYRAGDVLASSLQLPLIDERPAVCESYNQNYSKSVAYSNNKCVHPYSKLEYGVVGINPEYVEDPTPYRYIMRNYNGMYWEDAVSSGSHWIIPQKWIDNGYSWPTLTNKDLRNLAPARDEPYWLDALTLYHMDVPESAVEVVNKFKTLIDTECLRFWTSTFALTEEGYRTIPESEDPIFIMIFFAKTLTSLRFIDCMGLPPTMFSVDYELGSEGDDICRGASRYVFVPMIAPSEKYPITFSWSDNMVLFRNIYTTPDISALEHSVIHGAPTHDALNTCITSGAYGLLLVSTKPLYTNSKHVHHIPPNLRGILTNTLNGYYLTLVPTLRYTTSKPENTAFSYVVGYWIIYSQFGFLS